MQGYGPHGVDAAEQDQFGDRDRRCRRLDVVKNRLDPLVAGAAERNEVGLRIVPREAERNDVVHLQVLSPAAAGAERCQSQRLTSNGGPA